MGRGSSLNALLAKKSPIADQTPSPKEPEQPVAEAPKPPSPSGTEL